MNNRLFRKIIAGTFLGIVLGFVSAVAQTEKEETIRVETSLVSVPVVVSDRQGRYIVGLTKADFAISVDGKPQETAFFASEEEPLRVAILLDTSRSTEGILGKIKKAAKEFVRVLGPADSAMVVSFDYDVHINSPLTSDKRQLENAIKEVEIGEIPGTVMRDAVFDSVTKRLSAATGRKAIILLTDGKDFGSYAYESELLRTLEESDVMIFPIFYETTMMMMQQRFPMRRNGRIGDRNFPRRPRNEERVRRREEIANERAREYLEKMSQLTAGRFYEKKDNDLNEMFLAIADELRRQYRLGFYPDETADKTVARQIKVRVNRSDVSVRSRTSFRLKR
ncbi:MAG: VWA domain-containing protein [Acidobacteria bacterium]|nr:VWA domain-containing protein [Acidobacteriota bacterium]